MTKQSKLSDLGEIGLIRKIRKMIGPPRGNLKIGPGDDGALFKVSSKELLATTDMLIEGVHFDFKISSPFEVGWSAMTANLSDIAAMGGWPLYAVAAIGVGANTDINKIMAICRGMLKLAARFNCQIIGGDVVSTSGPLTISITVIGFLSGEKVFLRKSARPYDKILITGFSGKAAFFLRHGRFIRKMPRLEEIRWLSQRMKINALIDLSDGLSSDLAKITQESSAGALIFEKSLPVAPVFKKMKRKERLETILNGGEDFELLLTTPEKDIGQLISQFKKRFKLPLSIIGEIKPKRYGNRIRDVDGNRKILKAKGYEHFRS